MVIEHVEYGKKKLIMKWTGVTCIALALVLSIIVLFTNSWQTSDDSNISFGLNSVAIDCSDNNQWMGECTDEFNAILFADEWGEWEGERFESTELKSLRGPLKQFCINYPRVFLEWESAWTGGNTNESVKAAEHTEQECLVTNSAGNAGGIVILLGVIGAMFGTVLMVTANIGKTLPSNVERFGRISGWISGSLIILGCLIWMQMKSEPLPYGYDLGISFYLAIIAGLLAIGAGFLDMLENDKNPDEDD